MTAPAYDFAGRVVLVTGVARPGQIGHAVAEAFGRAGARVVACDKNAVAVAARVREFAAAGIDARPAAGDLTEPDVAQLAVEVALREFGRLDAVINVAGGLTTYGPFAESTVADVDREIAINLKTCIVVSQAAVEALAASRGSIVNFSSVAYFRPDANMAIYVAAKTAVAGFTRALAVELEPRGVRVNAVAPSMVRTPENVSAAGEDAAYVEMSEITDGVLALAADGTMSGEIVPIARGL
jgi:NAD(P)-dependent dehydrogenase (short-subunit alcohol dehydrogenase family)